MQEVTALGLPSLFADDSLQFDLARLVNCAHDLLQKHRTSSRIREELENRCVCVRECVRACSLTACLT